MTLYEGLKELWLHMSAIRKRQVYFSIPILLFTSIAELLSISLLIPLLGIITDPITVFGSNYMQPFIVYFGWTNQDQLLLPVTVFFIVIAVLSGLFRLVSLRINLRLVSSIGCDLGAKLFERIIYRPYEEHTSINSSEVIAAIQQKHAVVMYQLISPIFNILSSVMLMAVLVLSFLVFEPFIGGFILIIFALTYLPMVILTRGRIAKYGIIHSKLGGIVVRAIQEGLGGIRDVIIDNTFNASIETYRKANTDQKRVQAATQFLSQAPRFAVETVFMILISTSAYFVVTYGSGDTSNMIPLLGVIIVGAQRLLPTFQMIYSSWSNMHNASASLFSVLSYLRHPIPNLPSSDAKMAPRIIFDKEIELNNVSFKYKNSDKYALKSINLKINKGESIGILGETGSGKSTLLDILMGLLQPTSGGIYVDGVEIKDDMVRAWQQNICHVPQDLFLIDASIANNIALGKSKDEVDFSTIKKAAERACIASYIESLPYAYDTIIGERGSMLSGGQRQRIGIARALYKNESLMVLDEATSALDNETEASVIKSIKNSKGQTLIMIAHRLSTLSNCDKVIKISQGKISAIGSFESVVSIIPQQIKTTI
jgi:ATP-binding cassette, subfamily B, bacterial PglK